MRRGSKRRRRWQDGGEIAEGKEEDVPESEVTLSVPQQVLTFAIQ